VSADLQYLAGGANPNGRGQPLLVVEDVRSRGGELTANAMGERAVIRLAASLAGVAS